MTVQAGAFAEHAIEAVRYTACPDRSWIGGLYDYGHRESAVTEHHAEVRAPWLTVRLPASTRVRLTRTLACGPGPRRTPRHSAGILGSQAKPRPVRQRPGSLCHGPFGIGLFIRTDLGASPGAGSDAAVGEASRSAGQGHG